MKGEIFLLLTTIFTLSYQISTPESPDYVAGVVEYTPEPLNVPVAQRTEGNMLAYMQIIASEEARDVDILVFPEATLNRRTFATFVPNEDDQIAPCDDDRYEFYLRNISCAARTHKKYVVINLSQKYQCTQEEQDELNDPRPCSRDGLSYYNTNVVMNREGVVVSTYRKFHPFGEFGINTTLVPDISTFTTDFGVTFGHFICFDILFEEPAMDLIRLGVTDIVYPSMWFSELPFMTGVQTQYMWAWKNNVNFLGSGANNPRSGSTGSGIYAGRKGALTYVMAGTTMRRLLVARVPKIDTVAGPFTHNPVAIPFTETEMLALTLRRDNVDVYTTKLVDLSLNQDTETLCFDGLCCDFELEYTFDESLVTPGSDYYRYYMGVFNGVRNYYNVDTGGVLSCAIFACRTDDLASCATRFDATVNVVPAVTFTSIEINGFFPSGPNILTNPTTLNNVILPISFNDLTYEEGAETEENGEMLREIKMRLTVPHNDLRTFGIYGKNFDRDGEEVTTAEPTQPTQSRSVIHPNIDLIDIDISAELLS